MTEEAVFSEALKLPTEKRAELAAQLLRSLDGEPDQEVEAAWAAEIENRVRDAKAGKSRFEDWEVIRNRALERLRKK
jgi:putative addiction module component (TIGR02574 family)